VFGPLMNAYSGYISRPCSTSCIGFLCGSKSCSRLRLSSTGPCRLMSRVTSPTTISSSPMPLPCQTTAFCRHSNTRQSDAQQFFRQDLCCCRTKSLEQSDAQSQTMWAVIRPVQAATEDIFIWTVRPWHSVNCFNCAEQTYSHLLTYRLSCSLHSS